MLVDIGWCDCLLIVIGLVTRCNNLKNAANVIRMLQESSEANQLLDHLKEPENCALTS